MAWLHKTRLRWRALIKRRQLDRDLEEEIQFHLMMRAARHHESGMPPEEAAHAANRQFGNRSWWKENIRGMWSMGVWESVVQDIRYAVRSLSKTPAFITAAVLILALGIGSATAIFSMVNAVLLRSLPFHSPDTLVVLWGNVQRQKVERRGASYPDYQDWKSQSRSFTDMAAYVYGSFIWPKPGGSEQISGECVAPGYFELLGIKPVIGRTFHPDEDIVGKTAPVVLIGEGFWKRHFGSSPEVLRKQLILNQQQFTVIGVLPAWFRGLTDHADLWVPFSASAADLADRGSREFPVLARLKPGVRLEQAQVEMNGISKRLERAYPATNALRAVEVSPLSTETVGALRTPLMVLLGAVGFVLLVACANVANLLLVRAESRRQEIAIRAALGASRIRLFRQLLTESVVLAFVGGALGLLMAFWAIRLLTRTSPISLPTFLDPRMDWRVALVAVGLSAVVGLLVGIAPMLQVRSRDVHGALKESSARSGGHGARHRIRGALVISEVAVAMMLLVGAGLLMRSFLYLSAIQPGFDPNGILTLEISLPRIQPPGADSEQVHPDQRTATTARQLLDRVRALPSVTSASISFDYPFSGDSSAIRYSAEGQLVTDARTTPRAYRHRVSPEFFSTLRVPFIAGRMFTEGEINGSANVAVVSDNLARRFWPGQDPIGKRIKRGGPASTDPWWSIIGVVREMKFRGLPNNPTADPDIFLPFARPPSAVSMLVRTASDPAHLAGAVRRAIYEVDSSVVISDVSTMKERIGRYIERPRFSSWMMGIFAALALLLASVGLYAVMAYIVRQRTREFGIRIAVGATGGEVVSMTIREGMLLVTAGIAIGLILARVLTSALETLLFGISDTDAPTFIGVAAILSVVALSACYLPARRASRVDPVAALRHE